MASKGQTLPDGWVTTLIGLTGRLAFEVDGKTVAALQVDDQRIEVTGGDAGNAGQPRSLATCPSEDDVRADPERRARSRGGGPAGAAGH